MAGLKTVPCPRCGAPADFSAQNKWRPFCREHGVAVMAYSPVGRGRLLRDRHLSAIARDLGASPAQVALAWLLKQPGVSAIPKAASETHVRDNRAAAELRLSAAVLKELDRHFPPPAAATSLAML